jgi:gluconate kinase
VVILITGASHTGKTLLAQRLLERYGWPYLSADHLKMGLIRSGQTALTPLDDEALTDYLWPILREIVKTAVENRQNLVVEGCYIPFRWRQDFDESYLPSIRFLCMAMTEAYVDACFDSIRAHASDIEARLDDSGLTAEWLKQENRAVIEGFRSLGEPVTLIAEDYEGTMAEQVERFASDARETSFGGNYEAAND